MAGAFSSTIGSNHASGCLREILIKPLHLRQVLSCLPNARREIGAFSRKGTVQKKVVDFYNSVCKRKDSPYKVTEKPSRYWIKFKNPRYSQLEGRQELFGEVVP